MSRLNSPVLVRSRRILLIVAGCGVVVSMLIAVLLAIYVAASVMVLLFALRFAFSADSKALAKWIMPEEKGK